METTQSGGLVGLFRKTTGATAGAARSSLSFFAKPELWAVRLAFFAGILAIYSKSGIYNGLTLENSFALCIGLSGLMFEASSAKNVIRSFWEGRPMGAATWACLWIAAFAYSGFQWISVAAENEAGKTNIHKAAAYKTADVQSASKLAGQRVLDVRKKVENLRSAAWESIPQVNGVQVTSVAQAEALMAKQQSNTRFWTMTGGCKETKGPQTRAFCAVYNDAVSAKSANETRSATMTELKSAEDELREAEAEHAKAREMAAATPMETNEQRADFVLLASLLGVEGDHAEQHVEQYSAIFKILAVSIFLSLGAAMVELEKLRSTGPRRKLQLFTRLYRWAYGLIFGKPPANYEEHIHNHVTVSDDRALARLKAMAELIKVPNVPRGAAA